MSAVFAGFRALLAAVDGDDEEGATHLRVLEGANELVNGAICETVLPGLGFRAHLERMPR